MVFFAGLDWGDREHELVIRNEQGEYSKPHKFKQNAEGLSDLDAWVVRTCGDRSGVLFFVETKHGLLVAFLLEMGYTVYALPSAALQRWRKPSGAKTDAIDARLLAKYGASEWREMRPLQPDSDLVRELRRLVEDREALTKQSTRLINQITACLKEYYPVALEIFHDISGVTALEFVQRWPDLPSLRRASEEELRSFLGSHHYPGATAKADEIRALAAAPQLMGNDVVSRVGMRKLHWLVAQLRVVKEAEVDYDEQVAALFSRFPGKEVFLSLPGVGANLAPRLAVIFGDDRERYQQAQEVQRLAGSAAVVLQSGKLCKAKMRSSCVRPFRATMRQMAFSTLRHDPESREYYRHKMEQGKSHAHALRCLANRWIRIIFRMWKDGTTYDPAIFRQAQAEHRPRPKVA